MKNKTLALSAMLLITFSACKVVGTLHPISDNENDFIFKKELIGKWINQKDSSGFYNIDTLTGSSGKLYRVEIAGLDKENVPDTNWFLIRLVKIGNGYFLDCEFDLEKTFPSKYEDYKDWIIQKHFFGQISFPDPDKLEVSFPDPDELLKLIDSKKLMLKYSILKEDDYLILNKPKELKAELEKSQKYSLLYKEKDLFTRLK